MLHLHVHVLARQVQFGQLLFDLPHLLLPDVPHRVEQRRLVRRAQRREPLGVASLEDPQGHRAEGADFLREPDGAGQEEAESIVRRRRVEAGDHAAEIDARRRGPHEEAGIDRRIEQRAAVARRPECSCSCGS